MTIPCGKSELLLFNPISTQVCMDKANWVDIRPLNSPKSNGPITFHIQGADGCYLDLNDTSVYVRLKIITTKKTESLLGNDDVAPINFLLSSLFSDIQLTLNDRIIEGGDFLYPYKSFISCMLNYDTSVKNTQLACAGFVKDQAGAIDKKENIGHKMRSSWINSSLELMGALQLGFLQQSKYLLPNVNITLKMTKSKPEFYLMNFGNDSVKIEMDEIILYVRRVFVLPAVISAHENGLKTQNAIYPMQKTNINSYTLSKGSMSDSREILTGADIPKLIVIGFVENSAYNGDWRKSPYNFQHFNLSFLSLLRNGESIPGPPLQMDFKNGVSLRAYMSMIQNLEYFIKDDSNGITKEDFVGGTNLFVFNLTADLSFGGHCAQKFNNANLRLDLKFATPLENSINIIVYAVYDGEIEITKNRQIIQW